MYPSLGYSVEQKELQSMVPLSWCRVCSRNTAKDRVHYGGISCYSCRSFFRRNTNLGVHQLPPCKGSGSCTITDTARDQCRLCRYQKCMRQENVHTIVQLESQAYHKNTSEPPLTTTKLSMYKKFQLSLIY